MKKFLVLAAMALSFVACDDDDDNGTSTNSALDTNKAKVVDAYGDLVFKTYEAAYNEAVEMQTAINDFVANPTAVSHQAAKDAWLAAREPYGITEAFRFGNGPIDDEDGPEGLLNAWPLDEGYIDYTDLDANSGIINNTADYPTIDAALLESLNEGGAEENVSVGFHAIEFLLWGQDLNAGGTDYSKAGERSYTDFVDGQADNADRRGQYIKICAELLVGHLEDMKNEWVDGANNYRSSFESAPVDQSLANIMKGISILSKGELAGERIFVAIDNQDQEDEHSCFADNTHRDIVTNAQGIMNVFFCRNASVNFSGDYSLFTLIGTQDAALATELSGLISGSVTQAEAMDIPFDEALTNPLSRGKLQALVTNLQTQGDKLVEAGAKVGVTISADLPD
jgi:putative iron-regulated protein